MDFGMLPPLSNPTVVGFVEAELMPLEAASELAGQVMGLASGEPIPSELFAGVEQNVMSAVSKGNSLYFRFSLTELNSSAPTLIRETSPFNAPGLDSDNPNRKLTFILPIGGSEATLTLPLVEKVRTLAIGRIAIFPSFMANSITPEVGEDFVAVLGFAVGPTFV